MHRPWRRGPGGNNGNNRNDSGSREQGFKKTLNLEVLANQKRQWYRIKSKSRVLFYCLRPLPYMAPEFFKEQEFLPSETL